MGLATRDDLLLSDISAALCPCSFDHRSAVDCLASHSAAVPGALPAGAAVEQDELPDAEEVDSGCRASAEAAVPGEPQEDGPVVPAWYGESLVDGCSLDEHSDSGAVVPKWDLAVCYPQALAGPVGHLDCPVELSDCPAGQDGSRAEPAYSPGQPDAARTHDYCPERLVVAERSAVVPLRVRYRVRLSAALYRDYFREGLAAELHGCCRGLADFLELQGARYWDYCYCPAQLDGRLHDCFRLPDGYPEFRAVAPAHDHFLLPDDYCLDYQDAARRDCCRAHRGARPRGYFRLPGGYPERLAVARPHDHFLLPDGYYLVRPVVRHLGCCLVLPDAVKLRSDPARRRFHVRLVAAAVPGRAERHGPSLSGAALHVPNSALRADD